MTTPDTDTPEFDEAAHREHIAAQRQGCENPDHSHGYGRPNVGMCNPIDPTNTEGN